MGRHNLADCGFYTTGPHLNSRTPWTLFWTPPLLEKPCFWTILHRKPTATASPTMKSPGFNNCITSWCKGCQHCFTNLAKTLIVLNNNAMLENKVEIIWCTEGEAERDDSYPKAVSHQQILKCDELTHRWMTSQPNSMASDGLQGLPVCIHIEMWYWI